MLSLSTAVPSQGRLQTSGAASSSAVTSVSSVYACSSGSVARWVVAPAGATALAGRPLHYPSSNLRRRSRFSAAVSASQHSTSSPWDTLGVPAGASDKEVKKAYRKLAKRHHPDVSSACDAEIRFLKIQEAYEILCGRRRGSGAQESGQDGGWDFHDWFWQFRAERSWAAHKKRRARTAAAAAGGGAAGADPRAAESEASPPPRAPPPTGAWRSQVHGLKQRAASRAGKRRVRPVEGTAAAAEPPLAAQSGEATPLGHRDSGAYSSPATAAAAHTVSAQVPPHGAAAPPRVPIATARAAEQLRHASVYGPSGPSSAGAAASAVGATLAHASATAPSVLSSTPSHVGTATPGPLHTHNHGAPADSPRVKTQPQHKVKAQPSRGGRWTAMPRPLGRWVDGRLHAHHAAFANLRSHHAQLQHALAGAMHGLKSGLHISPKHGMSQSVSGTEDVNKHGVVEGVGLGHGPGDVSSARGARGAARAGRGAPLHGLGLFGSTAATPRVPAVPGVLEFVVPVRPSWSGLGRRGSAGADAAAAGRQLRHTHQNNVVAMPHAAHHEELHSPAQDTAGSGHRHYASARHGADAEHELQLQVVATGQHLAPEHERDGTEQQQHHHNYREEPRRSQFHADDVTRGRVTSQLAGLRRKAAIKQRVATSAEQ